ncbi:MAG: glycosyltransferase [Verrucomicrobia bacterium]|nr:glycosyltransferase [Verrucomicrobiota bacterium]
MRILVIQDYLRNGGTERQAVLLARAFHDAGHDATLLSFRPGGALACEVGGVPLRALQPFDTGLDWFAPGLCATVARLAPDVVLCMGRTANRHAAALQRRLPRAVVVATVRTDKPQPWLVQRSLHAARCVIANSHEAKKRLIALHGVIAEKIAVIHNSLVFPPDTAVPARDEALRAKHGAGPACVVMLCVAMFRAEKGQRALIEIAAQLPRKREWQLWLVGDGPTRAGCEALARELGVADRVRWHGFLADPRPLYRAADMAALASRNESLSNFLIEAQAHGLPAVAFDATGVGECFAPGESGFLIARGDAAGFRAALERLLADAALRTKMGARARAHAEAHFAPARQVRAYLELFDRLMTTRAEVGRRVRD